MNLDIWLFMIQGLFLRYLNCPSYLKFTSTVIYNSTILFEFVYSDVSADRINLIYLSK